MIYLYIFRKTYFIINSFLSQLKTDKNFIKSFMKKTFLYNFVIILLFWGEIIVSFVNVATSIIRKNSFWSSQRNLQALKWGVIERWGQFWHLNFPIKYCDIKNPLKSKVLTPFRSKQAEKYREYLMIVPPNIIKWKTLLL